MPNSRREAVGVEEDKGGGAAAQETADAQPAKDTRATEEPVAAVPRRPGARRGRLLWAGSMVVAAVALFAGLLPISWTYWVNSDGAGGALQGWDMLHGNLLLSGWWTADVSFYTFEIPIDALVEAVRGLNPGVVHFTAAIAYTLLVCVGALVARGHSRGGAGVAAALLAAGILLAPGDPVSAGLLLGSPDHIGVAVPILATLLFVDRARERWWTPPVACVLLVWAQLDDPMAEFAAAFALAAVCLTRAALGLLRSGGPRGGAPRGGGRAWRYDAALGVAAVASYLLTRLAVGLIRSAGGISMRQLQQATQLQPVSVWPRQLGYALHNTLALFGADYFDHLSGLLTAAALVHLVGAVLAAIGLLAGVVSLVRPGDRVTQTLTVGTLVTFGAGAFATAMVPGYTAHEIAVVLPFSAVLAGRLIGPWVMRRQLTRRALIPGGAVLLAAYLAFFGYFATGKPTPARTAPLDSFLLAHHLTNGLGRYWTGTDTRLDTGGKVAISAVMPAPDTPYPWITKPSWYDPALHTANFVVAGTDPEGGEEFSVSDVRKAFGDPARVYRTGTFIIMVYDRNLLRDLQRPVQPSPDTGALRL